MIGGLFVLVELEEIFWGLEKFSWVVVVDLRYLTCV